MSDSSWKRADVALSQPVVRTAYLWGPPGIGKTYAAYHYGRVQSGVYAVTLTEETPAAELRGHYAPKAGDMVWHDGPFTRAMREGARLVLNEISHASPDVLAILYPVLESEQTARLTLPTGETVSPAPGFHVIVTDNGSPDQLSDALRDRFDAILHLPSAHPDAYQGLPDDLRAAAQRTNELPADRRVSLRGWYAVARLRPALGLPEALRTVFGVDVGDSIHSAMAVRQGADTP